MAEKNRVDIGGSIFWILMILLTLAGMIYLLIWSIKENSIKGIAVATVMSIMTISGIVLSRNKIFTLNTWGDNSLSFTLGFLMWAGIGTFFKNFTIPQNQIFASVSSSLPIVAETTLNNFIVPISEEMFFMIGIPFSVIAIMEQIGKKYEVFKNGILQILIVGIIASVSFAYFHVGKATDVAFIISALTFRLLLIGLVYGDIKYDILKGINLVASFGLGSHVAYNTIITGFRNTFTILLNEIVVLLLVLGVFIVIFYGGAERIFLFGIGKYKNLIADN